MLGVGKNDEAEEPIASLARFRREVLDAAAAAGWVTPPEGLVALQASMRDLVVPNIEVGFAGLSAERASLLRKEMLNSSSLARAISQLADPPRRILREFKLLTPRNLIGVPMSEQMRLIVLSVRMHFGAADSIPTATTLSLLDAVEDDVSQVAQFLLDHAGDVLDGCEGTATTVSELEGVSDDHAILLLRAVDAYRAGFHEAAQALVTAMWDSHLTRELRGTDFINRMKKSPGGVDPTPESDVAQLYARADWGPAIAAYQNGRDNDYGRNQTIHHASLAQYSAVNGLRAITVGTSVLAHTYRRLLPLPGDDLTGS